MNTIEESPSQESIGTSDGEQGSPARSDQKPAQNETLSTDLPEKTAVSVTAQEAETRPDRNKEDASKPIESDALIPNPAEPSVPSKDAQKAGPSISPKSTRQESQRLEKDSQIVSSDTDPKAVLDQESIGSQRSPMEKGKAISERITIPAVSDSDSNEDGASGGEWALLSEKVRTWFKNNDLGELTAKIKTPAFIILGFLAFVLLLRIYVGVLETIAKVPLAPGLLELCGIIWVAWFSTTRLIRSQERQKVISTLQNTWRSFRGKVDP